MGVGALQDCPGIQYDFSGLDPDLASCFMPVSHSVTFLIFHLSTPNDLSSTAPWATKLQRFTSFCEK